MRVLILGGGGREHALTARCATERDVSEIVVTPGNPGIGTLARLAAADLTDPSALLDLAEREDVDLTVVGPELPLSVGVVDAFVRERRLIVGPSQAAARLETSKAFAKDFMRRYGVPTARFQICETAEEAVKVIHSSLFGFPVVLKADGLAAGKGVVVAATAEDAERAIQLAMVDRRFGTAGARLVIEECLVGQEVSFFALCDGIHAVPIGTAQDHKRVFDDDLGPNTGGMGAFSPSPLVDQRLADSVMREIVTPVLNGMAAEGHPFRGFLYAGLMLTSDGPKVIEFNVRLGDPEAQVLLSLIDEPLLPLLVASACGELRQRVVRLSAEVRVGVVLASRGYPDRSESGRRISGIESAERLAGVAVFHAGTAKEHGQLVTAGGRVLTVVGAAADFATAIGRAYAGVGEIAFDGMHYRRDIGRRALRTAAL